MVQEDGRLHDASAQTDGVQPDGQSADSQSQAESSPVARRDVVRRLGVSSALAAAGLVAFSSPAAAETLSRTQPRRFRLAPPPVGEDTPASAIVNKGYVDERLQHMEATLAAASTVSFKPFVSVQYDTANRSFGTGWADGRTWDLVTLPARSQIMCYLYLPLRNDSSGWGGIYTEAQYSLAGGGWTSLGNSGYTGVMSRTSHIGFYTNTFYFDFSGRSEPFTFRFKTRHRSYDGTARVNQSTAFSGNEFASKLTILQVGGEMASS